MSEAKQLLGPKQLAWVEALESGEFQQAQYVLFDGAGYCCLGVACKLSGFKAEEVEEDGNQFPTYRFAGQKTTLPQTIRKDMRFRGDNGDMSATFEHHSLAAMNDNDWTFAQIAEFVRAHPEAVFEEPA